MLVQQTRRFRRGKGQEHLRQDGREQRWPADAGRIPQGLPAGRRAVEDVGPLMRNVTVENVSDGGRYVNGPSDIM